MKLSEIEDADKLVTRDQLEVALGKLKNELVERINALEAKLNGLDAKLGGIDGKLANQRNLIVVGIIGILAQIINAWILHGK